jgi:indole-3-glycerol phosphate synthase
LKDITVDKVQVDAAKKIGADYFLLIQSIFDKGLVNDIDDMVDYGHNLGLKVLIEAHTKQEFENSCKTDADIIGINNRNLDTMKIDLSVTKEIPQNTEKTKLVISESGISTSDDIRFLHKCGADAYLVGSSIMKTDDIQQTVKNLVSAI